MRQRIRDSEKERESTKEIEGQRDRERDGANEIEGQREIERKTK